MLRRVLTAFSWRNPSIGYCQSMNIISALLLLFMPEEDAFWLLCTICEDMLQEYHCSSMIGCLVDEKVLDLLVQQHLPQVHQHLQSIGVPLALISIPWLLCVFVGYLPWEILLRALDCFFSEGKNFLFQMALGLLKLNQEAILEASEPAQLLQRFKQSGNINCNGLFKVVFHDFGPNVILRGDLQQLRADFRNEIEAEFNEPDLNNQSRSADLQAGSSFQRLSNEAKIMKFEEYCRSTKDLRSLWGKRRKQKSSFLIKRGTKPLLDGLSEFLNRSQQTIFESRLRTKSNRTKQSGTFQ